MTACAALPLRREEPERPPSARLPAGKQPAVPEGAETERGRYENFVNFAGKELNFSGKKLKIKKLKIEKLKKKLKKKLKNREA